MCTADESDTRCSKRDTARRFCSALQKRLTAAQHKFRPITVYVDTRHELYDTLIIRLSDTSAPVQNQCVPARFEDLIESPQVNQCLFELCIISPVILDDVYTEVIRMWKNVYNFTTVETLVMSHWCGYVSLSRLS